MTFFFFLLSLAKGERCSVLSVRWCTVCPTLVQQDFQENIATITTIRELGMLQLLPWLVSDWSHERLGGFPVCLHQSLQLLDMRGRTKSSQLWVQ